MISPYRYVVIAVVILAGCRSVGTMGSMPERESWERGIVTHRGQARAVIFSPDGTLCVSAGEDGRIYLIDIKKRVPVKTLRAGRKIRSMALSRDGKLLALGNSEGRITVLSFPEGKEIQSWAHVEDSPVTALAFSVVKDRVISGYGNGRAFLRDLKDDRVRGYYGEFKKAVTSVCTVSLGSYWVVITGSLADAVDIMRFSNTYETLGGYKTGYPGWEIGAVAAVEKRRLYLFSTGGRFYTSEIVINYASSTIRENEKLHGEPITALAASAQGTIYASGCGAGRLKIWDAAVPFQERLRCVRSLGSPVNSLAFSPTEDILAVSLADGCVLFWDLKGCSLE